jgi:hypothetical protein
MVEAIRRHHMTHVLLTSVPGNFRSPANSDVTVPLRISAAVETRHRPLRPVGVNADRSAPRVGVAVAREINKIPVGRLV